ncbi:glycoside hydrolase family 61 protein [Daldinia sp. EC12]|nr:glycoside hydrolase family 61 protein [Daldinia eschscholtzii]OTB13845.1 glycoside hydrolase family 61 protein [Daldinia sp. EC12]
MKYSSIALLGSSLLGVANAHYHFPHLILNNTWTESFEYVRQVAPFPDTDSDLALSWPLLDPDSIDIRCGRNASVDFARVKTATVQAGDRVGFGLANASAINGRGTMFHPGFGSAWLSKSTTDDLHDYAGDGDWFKILNVTGRTEQSIDFSLPVFAAYKEDYQAQWGTYLLNSYNFTIPESTPPGKYLLRWEHIYPIQRDSQIYVNCAHIEVVNPSDKIGTPTPTVKIPGVYKNGQPDLYFHVSPYQDFATILPPQPTVWSGN